MWQSWDLNPGLLRLRPAAWDVTWQTDSKQVTSILLAFQESQEEVSSWGWLTSFVLGL
jgi:hypothetical protein